jgi:tetratricopeptide (TPR) repeat protein
MACDVGGVDGLQAACRLKLQRWLDAIETCRIVLNLDPQNVKARYRRAEAHKGMGDYEKAIEGYRVWSLPVPLSPLCVWCVDRCVRCCVQDCLTLAKGAEAAACHKAIAECEKLEAAQRAKQKAYEKEMAEKLRTVKLTADSATPAPAPASSPAPHAATSTPAPSK